MKIRKFFQFFFIVSIVMLLGIILGLLHGYLINPDITPLNQTELAIKYTLQIKYTIPHMQGVFVYLTVFNIGVGLLLLIFPLYWVWVSWFSHNILSPSSVPMKATVYFLILAIGHNTFLKTYVHYTLYPVSVFTTMYVYHGIVEIFAYILAGTFSLLCIDAVRRYLRVSEMVDSGDLCVFLFHRIWRYILITVIFIVIGAFIECFITPELVSRSMEAFVR